MTDDTKPDFLKSDEYPRIDPTCNPTPRAQEYSDAFETFKDIQELSAEFRSEFDQQEEGATDPQDDPGGQGKQSSTGPEADKTQRPRIINTINDMYTPKTPGIGSGEGKDSIDQTQAVWDSMPVNEMGNTIREYIKYAESLVEITTLQGRDTLKDIRNTLSGIKDQFDDQIDFAARYLTAKNISVAGGILITGVMALAYLMNDVDAPPNNTSKNDGPSDGNVPMVEDRRDSYAIADDSQEVRLDTAQSPGAQDSVSKVEPAPPNERIGSLKQNESEVTGTKVNEFPMFLSESEKKERIKKLEQLKLWHTVEDLENQLSEKDLIPIFMKDFDLPTGMTPIDAILQLNKGIENYSNILFDDIEQATGLKIYSDVRQIERVNGDRQTEPRLLGVIFANRIYLSPIIPRDENGNIKLLRNDPRGVMQTMVELKQRATFAAESALRKNDESVLNSPNPKIYGIYPNNSIVGSEGYKVDELPASIVAEITEQVDQEGSAATNYNNTELGRLGVSDALASSAEQRFLYPEINNSWQWLQETLADSNHSKITPDSIGPAPE